MTANNETRTRIFSRGTLIAIAAALALMVAIPATAYMGSHGGGNNTQQYGGDPNNQNRGGYGQNDGYVHGYDRGGHYGGSEYRGQGGYENHSGYGHGGRGHGMGGHR